MNAPVSQYVIEDIPLLTRGRGLGREIKDYIQALKSLEVGQSFAMKIVTTHNYTTMSLASQLLDREFRAHKQQDGTYRVGRMK